MYTKYKMKDQNRDQQIKHTSTYIHVYLRPVQRGGPALQGGGGEEGEDGGPGALDVVGGGEGGWVCVGHTCPLFSTKMSSEPSPSLISSESSGAWWPSVNDGETRCEQRQGG